MERVGGFGGKADQLNAYYNATGTPDYFEEDLARYRAVTPPKCRRRCERYLPKDRRVELSVVARREEMMIASLQSRISDCSSSLRGRGAVGRSASAQAPDRSKPPAIGPAPALKLPAIQKTKLANGLPVWIVEQHEVPLAQVNLIVRSGSAADPRRQVTASAA